MTSDIFPPWPRGSMAVKWLAVRNFKSVAEEQRLEIGPLTIIAGANSSGKSTLLQPLLLIKQTIESPFDPGPLNLAGPNVSIASGADIVSKVPGANHSEIGFKFGFSHDEEVDLVFSHSKSEGVKLESMSTKGSGSAVTLKAGMKTNESVESFRRLYPERFFPRLSSKNVEVSTEVRRERCFFVVQITVREKGGRPFYLPGLGDTTTRYSEAVAHVSRRLLHLPGWRGNPERTYNTSAVGKTFPGLFQLYLATLIKQWQDEKSGKLRKLNDWLRLLGLTWKVEARSINETQIELKVGRLSKPRVGGAKDLVSIADVGFGVSQALPITVGLLAAEKGDVVYIEEPEIHLHPRAQERLADILVDAVSMGVRVVAETHSAILLKKLQTKVALGDLAPEHLKLHWCSRDEATGATRVELARVEDDGSFGKWPEDFGDVELEVESAYLDAVLGRKSGNGK